MKGETMTGWRPPLGPAAPGTPREVLAWWPEASALASRVGEEQALVPEGPPWAGFNGLVWPVRDATGTPLALKISHPRTQVAPEAAALRHWHGESVVRLQRADVRDNWILLERLEGGRSLAEHRPTDEAVTVIASIAAGLALTGPSDEQGAFPRASEWAASMCDSIETQRLAHPRLLERTDVDRAAATMAELRGDEGTSLLHFDLHFLNVLHTVGPDGGHAAWKAIDPLPRIGRVEWEATAMLRNRFEDAAATGDPDRSLRRRVDIFAEVTGSDAVLVRRIAQAVAVENLLWLLPSDSAHLFVDPYSLIARWNG